MTATILVVDDEPDLEVLVQQRFRRQIRGGEFGFRFARDGIEALDMIANGDDFDMVLSDINMPRMDGLTLLQKDPGDRRPAVDRYRLGLWRHGEYSHRDEPRGIRFHYQADRFR